MKPMLTIPDHIRGLVFDCDGTVADTMPLHLEAWRAALGEHRIDLPEAVFYELAGVPTARIIEILNDRHGSHMPVQATADRKEDLYLERVRHVTPIGPVVDVARRYRGKLPMAVATGGGRAVVTQTLAALDLLDWFDAIVTADDVVHGKPAPDIFVEAARRIGVPPEQCAGLEDGEMGLQSARAAGMLAIDVRPFYLPREPA